MRFSKYVAAPLVAATLLVFQYASQNYVFSESTPAAQQPNEPQGATATHNAEVDDVDRRAMAAMKQANSAPCTEDQHATAAGQSATQAQEAAQNTYNRADSLSGVADLDSYKPVSGVAVTFGAGSAKLTNADKAMLEEFGDKLGSAESYIVQVTGGSDSTGNADLNYELSQRRAEAVVQYLATKYNIPACKFYLIGIGKEAPTNATAAGRSKDRRVEVRLLTNVDRQAQQQQQQQQQQTEPSPPPTGEKPPAAADGMPRVTGIAILLPTEKEQSGYGLYSYALMSHRPQPAELPRVRAYLNALLDLPTAAAVERSVPRSRINITYLPLETAAPTWDTLAIDDKVSYVVDHYDYGRGAAMLASLSQHAGPGPVIISLLKPLNMSEHPHPVLVVDLTSAQPNIVGSYVSYFVDQAAKDRFWEEKMLVHFSLNLRNALEVMADGLGMSRNAVDSWVKFFK